MFRVSLCLIILSGILPAQESPAVKLQGKPGKVGDRTEVRIDTVLDLEILIKDSEGERAVQLSMLRSEQFNQELASDKDGSLVYRVSCAKSQAQKSGTNIPVQKESTPLQGRTYIVKKGPAVTMVELPDGTPATQGGENVGGWEEFSKLLPENEVRIGEQWVIDKGVTALLAITNLAETKSAALIGTLKEIQGTRAVLAFNGLVEGRTRDGSNVKVTVTEGALVIDTGTGRPSALTVIGTLESIKDVIQMYKKPGTDTSVAEKIGEVKSRSRKLEVKIAFQ